MWKGNGLLWNKIQEGGRMRKLKRYDEIKSEIAAVQELIKKKELKKQE